MAYDQQNQLDCHDKLQDQQYRQMGSPSASRTRCLMGLTCHGWLGQFAEG